MDPDEGVRQYLAASLPLLLDRLSEWRIRIPSVAGVPGRRQHLTRSAKLAGGGAARDRFSCPRDLGGRAGSRHLNVPGRTAPAVNLKLLIEGEEEAGSPGLAGLLKARRAKLAADTVVFSDTPLWRAGHPACRPAPQAWPSSGTSSAGSPDGGRTGRGKAVAIVVAGWLCGGMNDQGARPNSDLPADQHLRDDVAPAVDPEPENEEQSGFTPGQTNAGQQVGGLASAADYGKEQDPDSRGDTNNPV